MKEPRYKIGQIFYSRFNETRTITAVRYNKKLGQYFYNYDYVGTDLKHKPTGQVKHRECGEQALARWLSYQ